MLVGLGQSVEGLKNKNGGFEVKDRLCLKAEALTFVWLSSMLCGFQTCCNYMRQILKIGLPIGTSQVPMQET